MGKDRLPVLSAERGEPFEILERRAARLGILAPLRTRSKCDGARDCKRELCIIRDKGFADYFLIVERSHSRTPRICGPAFGAPRAITHRLSLT